MIAACVRAIVIVVTARLRHVRFYKRPVRADGETRRAREVIFRDDAIGHFVVVAHEVGGHAVDGLGYAVAIAVPSASLRAVTDKIRGAEPETSRKTGACQKSCASGNCFASHAQWQIYNCHSLCFSNHFLR
jgi:hypothetical protein